jgi:hypothetical protein
MADIVWFVAQMELDSLEKYLTKMSQVLQQEASTFQATIEARLAGEDAQDRDHAYEYYAAHFTELSEEFPARCMNNAFVSFLSLLEDEIVSTCERLQKKKGFRIGYRDIRGHGLEQYITYLAKMCEIEVSGFATEWAEVQHLQKVRNIIIHRRGYLEDDEKTAMSVKAYLEAQPGSNIDSLSRVALTLPFCLHALAVIKNTLEKLYDVVLEELEEG